MASPTLEMESTKPCCISLGPSIYKQKKCTALWFFQGVESIYAFQIPFYITELRFGQKQIWDIKTKTPKCNMFRFQRLLFLVATVHGLYIVAHNPCYVLHCDLILRHTYTPYSSIEYVSISINLIEFFALAYPSSLDQSINR